MSATRTLLYPLAALAVVGGLLYLRPQRTDSLPAAPGAGGSADAAPQEPRPFEYVHGIQLPIPPENFQRKGPAADRVERWFDRMQWSPSPLQYYTQTQIATLTPEEQRRFVELVAAEWDRDPIRAANLITVLGELDEPRGHEIILAAALHTSGYVRGEAARALSLLDSTAAAARAEELLRDPSEAVRKAAARALVAMKSPEALEALERYAGSDPIEGVRIVIHRLGQSTEDPSVIPVLRGYLDHDPGTAHFAIEALVRFGDANAFDKVYELLKSADAGARVRALTYLLQADPEWLDVSLVANHSNDTRPEVRQLVAEILSRCGARLTGDAKARAVEALDRMVGDADIRVYQTALAGLYASGRKDVAEPYLKGIEDSSGLPLHNAVDVVTHLFHDERSLAPLLARWKTRPNATDAATLLIGLGHLGDAAGVEPFLDAIRGASPTEPADSNGTALSRIAALHFSSLGAGALPRLYDLLDEDLPDDEAYLRALDALRGCSGPHRLQRLIDLALDSRRSLRVRAAALETLPFLKDPALFEVLSAALPRCDNVEIAKKARAVLFDYS